MNAAESTTLRCRVPQTVRVTLLLAVDLALVIPLGQTGGPRVQPGRPASEEAPDLSALRHQGNLYFGSGKYALASRLYETGYQEALRRGNSRSALRFLNNLGSARYGAFRYREAIDVYLKARDLALSLGDRGMLVALYGNLSSLYLQVGDLEDALNYSEQALRLPDSAASKYKAQLLLQSARIKAGQSKFEESADLLRAAVGASQDQADLALEAQAWNELGDALLELGSLGPAEHALLEAFRLRTWTNRDRLYCVYQSLGKLYALRGDAQRAQAWFERAVASARAAGPSALWDIYYERGKFERAGGGLREAFRDFAAALDCVRRARGEALPADAFRISAEAYVDGLYSAYIETGIRLYGETGQPPYAARAFTAAEEHRSATLRSLRADRGVAGNVSDEYEQALADLHEAESGWISGSPAAAAAEVQDSHLKMAELEVRAHLDLPAPPESPGEGSTDLLAYTMHSLRATEVFLGFHLGDEESWLWVVTRDALTFYRLPPRRELVRSVAAFVEALRQNSPEFVSSGRKIYSQLFGGVPRRLLDKPVWIVAADGPLFELPFAALPEMDGKSGSGISYVVERHAIKLVTGVSENTEAAAENTNRDVVGLGDPIYNRADPRLPRSALASASADKHPPSPKLELARLAGSSRELDSYADLWRSRGYQPVLLQGSKATRQNFLAALRANPAIVHIAAHLVFPPDPSSAGLLALALQPNAGIELLSSAEVAAWRLKLGLIVVNGCSSGHAKAIPGSGLMGMTRAWLAAGARAVVLTRWPISDQTSGELLHSFYQQLMDRRANSHVSFGELLQQAQLAELRAGGERANPANWAAYFSVETN